jgi:hypothetical protein
MIVVCREEDDRRAYKGASPSHVLIVFPAESGAGIDCKEGKSIRSTAIHLPKKEAVTHLPRR